LFLTFATDVIDRYGEIERRVKRRSPSLQLNLWPPSLVIPSFVTSSELQRGQGIDASSWHSIYLPPRRCKRTKVRALVQVLDPYTPAAHGQRQRPTTTDQSDATLLAEPGEGRRGRSSGGRRAALGIRSKSGRRCKRGWWSSDRRPPRLLLLAAAAAETSVGCADAGAAERNGTIRHLRAASEGRSRSTTKVTTMP
jgi:hypothetical protein